MRSPVGLGKEGGGIFEEEGGENPNINGALQVGFTE